jgi:hypothetical protein
MRMHDESTQTTLLYQVAQAILPERILLALFGRPLMPVRVESARALQARAAAERRND